MTSAVPRAPAVDQEAFTPYRRAIPDPTSEIPAEPPQLPIPGKAAIPPEPRRVLAGDWLYVPEPIAGGGELYPPEYIDLRLNEHSGVLRGRYRARYRVGDRAISPTVAFQFAGPAGTDRASLPWIGDGGAKGEIELHLLGDGSLEVTWIARSMGTEMGLISGTAKLVRKAD